MIRSMSYLFFYTYFIFWLFVVDLEESQFCFWPWHFRLFSLLFKSSHHLGQCSASSCSSVVWDKSLTMFLLLCSVKAYFWFFGYCNNVSNNLHCLKTSVGFLCVCRHWNLHWQCAGPFLIHGCMSCLCLWLYDASSLCLLFKGLDISPVRYISPWPSLLSSLVVGCSWKK